MNFRILYIFVLFSSCNFNSSLEEERYENGKLKYVYKIKNGLKEGEAFKYYPDGAIMQKSNWKEGKKNGITETYYKNGKINIRGDFKNGEQQGWTYKYDSFGNLKGKTSYEKSIENGPFETYYQTGKVKSHGTFFNGIESATYFYFEDGSPERYEYLKNDSLIYLKKYNESGKLVASLLPINVIIRDDVLCVELIHSIVPKESLRTCLFLQSVETMTVNLGEEVFKSESDKICLENFNFGESVEGFLCECLGEKYECMPFKYLIDQSEMVSYDPVYF